MIKKLLAGLGLTLAFAIPALAAEEITFGIISTESTQNLKKAWEPMLADLDKKNRGQGQRVFRVRLRWNHRGAALQ